MEKKMLLLLLLRPCVRRRPLAKRTKLLLLGTQLLLLGTQLLLLKGTKLLLLQMGRRPQLFPLKQLLRRRQYPMVKAAPPTAQHIPKTRIGG